MWAGIDVGGRRKGFDIAIISNDAVLRHLSRSQSPTEVVEILLKHSPRLLGIDCPESPAGVGAKHRPCELLVNREVCGIRWTPDSATIGRNQDYYGWLSNGFELWNEVRAAGMNAVEVFPTASWTIWNGRRGKASRSRWSREGIAKLGVIDLPTRMNQDERDAVASAWTARMADLGQVAAAYEPIVIPLNV
jgi:predicted nuclease with RNAse H fold